MKERPILFSGPMVRAILDGTKRQTRRIVKPQPTTEPIDRSEWECGPRRNPCPPHLFPFRRPDDEHSHYAYACPYGVPGDRLWVRERWAAHDTLDDLSPQRIDEIDEDRNIWYAVDGDSGWGSLLADPSWRGRWRPSIHMPRWASRITLEIADVRVQRLQDISGLDAIAEGLDHVNDGAAAFGVKGFARSWSNDPRVAYRALWESINGAGSWDANPWVWAISFRVDHD